MKGGILISDSEIRSYLRNRLGEKLNFWIEERKSFIASETMESVDMTWERFIQSKAAFGSLNWLQSEITNFLAEES